MRDLQEQIERRGELRVEGYRHAVHRHDRSREAHAGDKPHAVGALEGVGGERLERGLQTARLREVERGGLGGARKHRKGELGRDKP